MYISLNWIRDFVDLPTDVDPRALAERFTLTTAEVEGIEEIRVDATGLVSAEIKTCAPIPDRDSLRLVTLDAGGNEHTTVTAAGGLKAAPLAKESSKLLESHNPISRIRISESS